MLLEPALPAGMRRLFFVNVTGLARHVSVYSEITEPPSALRSGVSPPIYPTTTA